MSQVLSQVYGNQIISVIKQCPASPQAALPYRFYLTDAGGSSNSTSYVGDYSGGGNEKILYFDPAFQFDIYGLLINISDSSKFYRTGYGGLASGLTVGVKFFITLAGTEIDVPILYNDGVKINDNWLSIDPSAVPTSWEGTDQTLPVHVNVANLFGGPLTLAAGAKLKVVLNDNFVGLDHHTFKVTGQYYVNG